jgi:hypothetical protein
MLSPHASSAPATLNLDVQPRKRLPQPPVTRTSKRVPGTSTNQEGILGNPQGQAAPKEAHSPSPRILHPSGEEFQAVSGHRTEERGPPKVESTAQCKVQSKENTKPGTRNNRKATSSKRFTVFHCS